MSFLQHLEAVVSQVEGAIACSVMGFDGIAVETHQAPALAEQAADLELQTAWVEYGDLLLKLKDRAESMKTGGVSELAVNTEKLITVMRLVTNDYFVVLAMKPSGNFGKGRYLLRLAAPRLKADLQ